VWQCCLILWMLCMGSARLALAQPVPQGPCGTVAAPQKAACYRQHFSTADRELNAVYKRLYARCPFRKSAASYAAIRL
jgi:uncharacterized protein YecT (DUF1311 family)